MPEDDTSSNRKPRPKARTKELPKPPRPDAPTIAGPEELAELVGWAMGTPTRARLTLFQIMVRTSPQAISSIEQEQQEAIDQLLVLASGRSLRNAEQRRQLLVDFLTVRSMAHAVAARRAQLDLPELHPDVLQAVIAGRREGKTLDELAEESEALREQQAPRPVGDEGRDA